MEGGLGYELLLVQNVVIFTHILLKCARIEISSASSPELLLAEEPRNSSKLAFLHRSPEKPGRSKRAGLELRLCSASALLL